MVTSLASRSCLLGCSWTTKESIIAEEDWRILHCHIKQSIQRYYLQNTTWHHWLFTNVMTMWNIKVLRIHWLSFGRVTGCPKEDRRWKPCSGNALYAQRYRGGHTVPLPLLTFLDLEQRTVTRLQTLGWILPVHFTWRMCLVESQRCTRST